MNFNEYKETVEKNYNNIKNEEIPGYTVDIMYEEKFEWKWIATKLKMFSFVGCSEKITEETIRDYTKKCFEYSKKNYKGLSRGLQNGFVSFALLVSDNVDESAVKLVQGNPKKHFAAFEMPVIFDLRNQRLYFCEKTPMWGAIYYKYLREYIMKHFGIRNL